jgi:hypothetical protein
LKSSPEQADAASTHFRHRVRTLPWMPLWHLTVTEGANPILLLWQPHVLGRADCHERRRPLVAFPTEVKAEEVRQKLLAMQKEPEIEP